MGIPLTLIARKRAELRLSVVEASKRAGVGPFTWTQIEGLERRPQLTTVAKMADALGLDLQDVLDDISDRLPEQPKIHRPDRRRRSDRIIQPAEEAS